ncbi:leucine rich repeat protein [Toxoplasma gondii GAB2-2007-GAL-DOM2]|uniref:Leucine rich repeat protein n=1 Tax=Toxoplasma gondii GAB2-2007-GAL-DOM2 TaxID=1130820 RepID=A0A086KBG2_TOXGO|nr:leucine rich repeat protein [Toxoplasma gondii GAB2-2007-GAL-DOM2]
MFRRWRKGGASPSAATAAPTGPGRSAPSVSPVSPSPVSPVSPVSPSRASPAVSPARSPSSPSGKQDGEGQATVYTSLSEEVFEKFIGPSWHRERLQVLDFSSAAFCLETVTGPEGGLLNPRLRVQNLAELNLGNNALTTADSPGGEGGVDDVISAENGFRRLTKLILTRNLIQKLDLSLPTLQVLVVDSNRLKAMPTLDGLRNLRILNLAHNQITG